MNNQAIKMIEDTVEKLKSIKLELLQWKPSMDRASLMWQMSECIDELQEIVAHYENQPTMEEICEQPKNTTF